MSAPGRVVSQLWRARPLFPKSGAKADILGRSLSDARAVALGRLEIREPRSLRVAIDPREENFKNN